MFSVTAAALKIYPLSTRNVWPTKSGVTIERRAQVLIGFFAPELFILSIFSKRCDSTKGPFFNDLAINVKFPSHLSSRSTVEGSRGPSFKFSQRDSSTLPRSAQNDKVLYLLLPPSPFQNEPIARFVFRPRFKSFCQLSPRAHRMMPSAATFGFALAATHRMIDRIHRHASHVWTPSLPAGPACFAARHVHVIDIADLANRRVTGLVNPPDFARRHFHQ